MLIQLVCVGEKMPAWISAGYEEYAKRLPRECELKLREVPAGKRGKNSDMTRLIGEEGERLLAAVPSDQRIVALDLSGTEWSTPQLSQAVARWLGDGRNVSLLVGGPDGLSSVCLEKASERWRLSALTLPHPLVRVVVAEQIYRAWSLLNNHPYHR